MEATNYMEYSVDKLIDKVIQNSDVCKCERCRLDIKAITLNNLPPKYVVTPKGELFSKVSTLEYQFEVNIITEITKAIAVVKKNKRHD